MGGITLYGIRNCDTCRRALRWLAERGIDHRFHDLRADGVDRATIDAWADALGVDALLNRRGRTWRELDPARRERLDEDGTRTLLAAEPLLIKRPVLALDGRAVDVGFEAERWRALVARDAGAQ